MDYNRYEYKIRVTKSLGSKTGTVSLIFFYNDFLSEEKNELVPVYVLTEKSLYSTKNCRLFWINGRPVITELIFIFFDNEKLTKFLFELKKKWLVKGQNFGL